ncbi:unnamed protein product [Symbiodinium natans]|uniref:Transmembrane protein n=1 Tax=Symbiodinium natans TaxID=878477 RepID=A0A812M599_9DINO|nr:unnamed protein product [Symbiodinium natans]
MEHMLADIILQQPPSGNSGGGLCPRLVCFVCLLATALAFSATALGTRDKERRLSKLSVKLVVTGLCFVICAASCTFLTYSEQVKAWWSLGACASSLMALLAPSAVQRRSEVEEQSEWNEWSERNLLRASSTTQSGEDRTLRTTRASRRTRFQSALQVIHENAMLAITPASPEVSSENMPMIIAAIHSLATQRKKWGRRPNDTWGKFLTKLDTILGQKSERPSRSSQSSLLIPSGAWYEISRWCARRSPHELQSIVETAIKLHRAPGEEVLWELGRTWIPPRKPVDTLVPADAEKLAELLMRLQVAIERPLRSFSEHLKPALARRIHVGTMDYMGGSHESYRRTFEFIEMTNTWHDVDTPTRDIGDLYRKKLKCSYKDPSMYKALAARAADKRDSFRMVVKVSCVATHLMKLQNMWEWWPTLWQEKYQYLAPATVAFLWQFPPSFVYSHELYQRFERLVDFLAQEGSGVAKARHIVDFRDGSWYREDVYDFLRARKWCLAWLHLNNAGGWASNLPSGWTDRVQTTNFCFCRLFGPDGQTHGTYDNKFLHELFDSCPQGTTTYVLFGNKAPLFSVTVEEGESHELR